MDLQPELFRADTLPPRCTRFLRSSRAPALAARAQVTAGLARCFLPAGVQLGVSALVNASRLLGARFDNCARAGVGAAAGLPGGRKIPAELVPDPAEVREAKQWFARSLLRPWQTAGEYLQRLAEGSEE